MSQSEIISNTYLEELYQVPLKPIVALPNAWKEVSENEKILLDKILKLAGLSLLHVKIISCAKLEIMQWLERPDYVIAFGIEMPGLVQNEVLEIKNIKMIITSSLALLENAPKELKQKLASALKQMFQQ